MNLKDYRLTFTYCHLFKTLSFDSILPR